LRFRNLYPDLFPEKSALTFAIASLKIFYSGLSFLVNAIKIFDAKKNKKTGERK